MSRFYLRLTLIPIALFTLVLILIRAQPYDDHELRQLLLPEGCPAPCFMGIRPGVTTKDEAMKLLQKNKWVASYDFNPLRSDIRIRWSRNSPLWLANDGFYDGSIVGIRNNIVYAFVLDTTLKLGDLWLLFGETPFQKNTLPIFESTLYLSYAAYYPQMGLSTSVWVNCTGKRKHITYQDIVYLGYIDLANQSYFMSNYHDSWVQVSHTFCKQK